MPNSDDPMPVFTIKAKDKLALRAVDAYRVLCESLGLDEQAREVELAYAEMDEWRQRNADQIKLPDHPHVPARGDCRCGWVSSNWRTANQASIRWARHVRDMATASWPGQGGPHA